VSLCLVSLFGRNVWIHCRFSALGRKLPLLWAEGAGTSTWRAEVGWQNWALEDTFDIYA
jgi:hypothetical protein